MLSIDTIKAKAKEKAKETSEAVDNSVERHLLMMQRKWVDRTAFWANNMVNNRRLNKAEGVLNRTGSRVSNIDSDIEMNRIGIEAEMRILNRQRDRNIAKGRPTDIIDAKIADRQSKSDKKMTTLESKRNALLVVKQGQEKSKDALDRTKKSISNEMNDKINKDIALIENQFNFKGLKYKESMLSEELAKMDADVAEIQSERDQMLADAAELGQRGKKLREILLPLDKELKKASQDRNKVFKELSGIQRRIGTVEDKKAGWENLRTALGVATEAIPKDRSVEASLMRARTKEEQKKRFKDSDPLKNFVVQQAPDSYAIEARIVNYFFKDIRDEDGFDKLEAKDVRRESEKMLVEKRKAENEAKLLTFNEKEKIASLEKESDALWDYVFQKLITPHHSPHSVFIEELIAGPYRDSLRNDIVDGKLRAILNNVGYAFDNKEYNTNKDSFNRILMAKANERFVKLMAAKDKNEQERFFRHPDHSGYVNSLVDGVIVSGNYTVIDSARIKDILVKNGLTNIESGDIDDRLSARSIELVSSLDLNGQLGILRKDSALKTLLLDSGVARVRDPALFDYVTFHAYITRKGFDMIEQDDQDMRNIVADYINKL